jgi:hypothetical protein
MRFKFFSLVLLSSVLALATGCVETVDGHMKAGMPLTQDKIVKRFDRSLAQTITATRTVLTRDGRLEVDNIAANTFQAQIKNHDKWETVWVKLEEVESKLTQVTVQARTTMGTDIDLAADISTRIALQLTVTP